MPNVKEYNHVLSEMRRLLGKRTTDNWAMGDILLAITPYSRGKRRPGTESVRDVAKRLETDLEGEVKAATLMNLRATSYAWPPRERKKAAWSAHFHLKHNQQLLRNGMTGPQAMALVAKKNPRNRFRYACRLLRSSITFMQSAERYLPELASDEERMTIIGPLLNEAEEALDAMLDAAGMTEGEVRSIA